MAILFNPLPDDPKRPYTTCRYRSPQSVSEAIKDIIKDKLVCELGASIGDNMMFMSRYAGRVIGTECHPERFKIAKSRGLDIIFSDYHKDAPPNADVYYVWPSNALKDDEFLMRKILGNKSFKGTLIIAGDSNAPPKAKEVITVRGCAKLSGGYVMEVPYNEGKGDRLQGTMVLAVIDAKMASL